MSGCSAGRRGSDDVDMALGSGAAQAELLGPLADVGDGHGIEAGFDARRQIPKDRLGDAPRVGARLGAPRPRLPIPERDRAFERAHHVAEPDVDGPASEAVAALRSTFRADDAGALQILENLLQKSRRDRLALGDVAHLRGTAVVVEGDVEERSHGVATLVRQLHGAGASPRKLILTSDLSRTSTR